MARILIQMLFLEKGQYMKGDWKEIDGESLGIWVCIKEQ